jgi:O-antigen ligase
MTWSQQPQISRAGSLVFYVGAVALTLIFQRRSWETLYRASSLLLVLMTVLTLFGLYLFASGRDHWFQFTSETATAIGTRNADAFMVATIFPLALSRTIVSGGRLSFRVLAGGAGAVCVAAVLLSLSRSSTAGILMATLVILGFGSRLIPVRPRTIVIVAVLSVVTYFLLKTYFATSELSFTRFSTLNQSSRIPLAQTALDTGLTHPFTGVGYFEFTSLNSFGEDAHDAYLNLFAELGIPGVALFLLMLGAPLISYMRLVRLPQWGPWLPTRIRVLYLQGFGMLLTLTLLAATDTFYKSIYFWIVYMLSIMHLASARTVTMKLSRGER